LLPVLEASSGKSCGRDFGLCYGPEFIALGSVIRDFLNPDFYLIGEFDQHSGDVLEDVNRKICVKEPVLRRMSIENAEIAKIALNSYVTMKISFANTLADICERIPGGDVDVVSDAIGSDTRIGRKYLTGGLGFAGPCFPRDNVALGFLCEHVGADGNIVAANHGYNKSITTRIATKIAPLLQMGQTAAVLGLSYKPLSHVVEESQGVALALAMAEAGMRVIGYDPLASDGARSAFRDKALVAESIDAALADAALVVVTTPDASFRALKAEGFLGGKESVTVVDCWRCLDPSVTNHPKINYVPLGRCVDDGPAAGVLEAVWAN
jgi:UDPglucose 6-dehydrogenase